MSLSSCSTSSARMVLQLLRGVGKQPGKRRPRRSRRELALFQPVGEIAQLGRIETAAQQTIGAEGESAECRARRSIDEHALDRRA